MRRNVTEVILSRLFSDMCRLSSKNFKHHFCITKRTFKSLSGNGMFLTSQNMYCIYDLSFIHLYLYLLPANRWFHSSVGRALHRYRRGHGLESRSGLKFFQALISQLLKLCV